MDEKIRLGISTCLLGEKVRYDGGHKLDPFLRDTLGQYVEYVPVCPEVECGLPVPREAMHLVGPLDRPRLVTVKTGIDHTDRMTAWGRKRLRELEDEGLCGYIFKSKSPSSGMERVKVYNESGMPEHKGVGIWARLFMDHFPLLPAEEEGRLHDPKLREMFVERIFVLKRWREQFREGRGMGGLVDFHTRHKLIFMAHSPQLYRELGRMIGEDRRLPLGRLFQNYLETMARALSLRTTVKKNVNVLQHIMGYFKKDLSSADKAEFLEIIDQYARGVVPLIVPLTLANHYVRRFEEPYLQGQYYLRPHPIELKLHNHV